MLEVEEISKMYRIGTLGTGSLARDIQHWWNNISRRGNPSTHTPEVNDHSKLSQSGFVWSLKDISFHLHEGDVLGIIGKNGAGKSTLLKIISKITRPTSGSIRINGRVVSLLEVGTGFHPDLSGRENIYLNGAILGMTKQEMNRKFDEIVSFSEIERYIDTPVKRYSSGMYVRLGFAVAAHLEPEILIVDEVLAVGDFEFQQKCLGKMKDVSHQGRTVLFVSHSLPAIKQLCNKGLLLEKGMMKSFDHIDKVLEEYQVNEAELYPGVRQLIPGNQPGYFMEWKLAGKGIPGLHSCYSRDHCTIIFRFRALEYFRNCEVRFMIKYEKLVILHGSSIGVQQGFSLSGGYYNFRFSFDFPIRDAKLDVEMVFLSDRKIIDTWLSQTKLTVLDNFESHVNAGMLNPEIDFAIEEEKIVSSAY